MSMSKQERQKDIESLSRLGAERLAAVIVDALEGISERRRSTEANLSEFDRGRDDGLLVAWNVLHHERFEALVEDARR